MKASQIKKMKGYRDIQLLKREVGNEFEFTTIIPCITPVTSKNTLFGISYMPGSYLLRNSPKYA